MDSAKGVEAFEKAEEVINRPARRQPEVGEFFACPGATGTVGEKGYNLDDHLV